MTLTDLMQTQTELQRLYLRTESPGLRIRIDAALSAVEAQIARRERDRLLQQIAGLPARLQSQAALLAALRQSLSQGDVVEEAQVQRAVDGDTILLANGERVRYVGIDAPELNNGFGKSGHPQPFSRWATEVNADLVAGKSVRLLVDRRDRDRYGRLLRYVFCGGEFVNARLLLAGAAHLYILPPDVRFADLLARCELHAQGRRLGIWQRES